MKLLERRGGLEGDSRVPISYRIADDAGERVVQYKPEGAGRITLQTVALLPLSPAQRSACVRSMSGG